MPANTMTIQDISAVANQVIANAQGKTPGAVNTSDFTTIAQIALQQGFDPLTTAISQVLSRTIFSIRPYSAKFRGLEKDAIRWGNHVRKLNPIDKPLEVDNRLRLDNGNYLADGDSIDPYRINKPEVLQTNFYGENTYQKSMTIWKDQLDTAFNSPEQFGNFLTMMMTNATDQLTQTREEMARGCLVNLIAGTAIMGNVWHALTDYNTETGGSFTKVTIMDPANFAPFFRWFVGKLQTIMDRMTERTILNHVNPFRGGTQKFIMRHTPISLQHLYMMSEFVNKAESVALSTTFHDDYLKKMDYEKVNFWQVPGNPGSISTTASYLATGDASTDAAITTAAFASDDVLGVLFDDEAAGINLVNQWPGVSPFNPRGGYYNQFWHETARWFNDNSENCLVIALD